MTECATQSNPYFHANRFAVLEVEPCQSDTRPSSPVRIRRPKRPKSREAKPATPLVREEAQPLAVIKPAPKDTPAQPSYRILPYFGAVCLPALEHLALRQRMAPAIVAAPNGAKIALVKPERAPRPAVAKLSSQDAPARPVYRSLPRFEPIRLPAPDYMTLRELVAPEVYVRALPQMVDGAARLADVAVDFPDAPKLAQQIAAVSQAAEAKPQAVETKPQAPEGAQREAKPSRPTVVTALPPKMQSVAVQVDAPSEPASAQPPQSPESPADTGREVAARRMEAALAVYRAVRQFTKASCALLGALVCTGAVAAVAWAHAGAWLAVAAAGAAAFEVLAFVLLRRLVIEMSRALRQASEAPQ